MDLQLLDAVGAPTLAVGPDRTVTFANQAAHELFSDGAVGQVIDSLFRDPGAWDLCRGVGSLETDLIAENLPVRASVRTSDLPDDHVLATVIVHEVREMLAGLTQILTGGGDLELLFKRLTPFLLDRIPYVRCSLMIWHEALQQFEVYSHHPLGDDRDQRGEMVDVFRMERLLSAVRDRQQPVLRDLEPASRAWVSEQAGIVVGPVVHLPLHSERKLMGVVTLGRSPGERFESAEVRQLRPLVGTLALGIAGALERREATRRRRQPAAPEGEAPAMVHVIDATGRILEISPESASALGYTPEELVGSQLASLLASGSREQLARALADFSRTGRVAFQGEREFVRKDGSTMLAQVSSTAERDEEGKLLRVRTVLADITEALAAQRGRLQAQKLESLGRMIAGITHELNNLLGPILGYAQLLQRRAAQPQNELKQIEEAAQKARGILDSMLRFARQTKPQKRYQDLGEIVDSTIELISGRAKRHNIEIIVERPGRLPWTRVDENHITQLFLNLLNNAIEAAGDRGGRVRIDVIPQGMWLQVIVRDDCGGIDEAILPHLFDPFFSGRADGRGTGMGLATCFGIVADHGGSIDAGNATLEDKPGARFEIMLPVRRRPTYSFKRRLERAERPDLTGLRALVVEDDARYNTMICTLLEQLGATVDAAVDGQEGSERLAAEEYDLVVSDIRMPGMGGTALFEWIGEHQPQLAPRVLLVTGDRLDERTRRLTERLGLHPLVKPFEVDTFYERVGELMRAR